jgi:hypothetical protein
MRELRPITKNSFNIYSAENKNSLREKSSKVRFYGSFLFLMLVFGEFFMNKFRFYGFDKTTIKMIT